MWLTQRDGPSESRTHAKTGLPVVYVSWVRALDYFFIATTRIQATAPMRSTDERTIPVTEPTPSTLPTPFPLLARIIVQFGVVCDSGEEPQSAWRSGVTS